MTTCKRCGTCCKNGGPALHKKDLLLFKNQNLRIDQTVTIRKNEPAFNPISQKIEPAQCEFIKLAGIGNTWQCIFFNPADNTCSSYQARPIECNLLQCWDTIPLTEVIFKDVLTRWELIEDKIILEMIDQHEKHCSFTLFRALSQKPDFAEMSRILNHDLKLRQEAFDKYNFSLAQELFYFGRPMFKSANFFGVSVQPGYSGFKVLPNR